MKKPGKTILIYVLLIVTVLLALFYYFRSKKFKKNLVAKQEQSELTRDLMKDYQSLLSIDSLVIEGDYDAAVKAYRTKLNDSLISPTIQMRIELANQLKKMQQSVYYALDTLNDTLDADTISERSFVSPEEIRQYDSLNFALAKANMQLENLQRQLRNKMAGEYLTFSTTKGNKVHYVGEVKNDKANGRGVALLNTGSRYEGEWRNNLRHGQGTFYWPDGEYYVGEYKDDQRHGQGTYYWPNGEKYVGEWKNDERNGEGIFYGKEGEIVASGTWKNDELVEVEK